MPRDDDRLDEHERRADAKRRAREILDRADLHEPPAGKEPRFNDEIPADEHRGSWRAVRGGGEPV